MSRLLIRSPRAGELPEILELCLRSKAHWGYDAAFVEACRDELTLTQGDLRRDSVAAAEIDGMVVGVVHLSARPPAAELEKLFVCPDRMERGIGRILFEWAVAAARQGECDVLTVASDPGAAAFYRRMGCRDSGEAPSGSIPGRTLPRLELIL